PLICEMSAPTTRFSTALEDDCWMKRVTSPAPIEKPCQLMIAPGELVTLSVRASGRTMLTAPLTTCGPVGFDQAVPDAKQQLTASASGRARSNGLLMLSPRTAPGAAYVREITCCAPVETNTRRNPASADVLLQKLERPAPREIGRFLVIGPAL